MDGVISWLAPILSTIIVTAATAAINLQVQRSQRVADERHAETEVKRAVEAEWRASVDARLDSQDERIFAILKGQTTQMRSDLVHKAHRYIDDLGCASTEEKDAFHKQYVDYCAICEAHGIENSFVDRMAQQVMALPSRQNERGA